MIRLFVGCSANDEDLEAQMVFEYSLREHHPADDVEITWMRLSRDESSFWYSDPDRKLGWRTTSWATPFSALRWGIPAFCNYEGLAIYADCDIIWMDDVQKLWDHPWDPGKAIVAKGQSVLYCTMLMDCAALQNVLPPIEDIKTKPNCYRDIRRSLEGVTIPFKNGNWNCRDGEHYSTIYDPDVKVLHYTAIPTQPTHRHAKARLAAEGRPHWFAGESLPHPRKEVSQLFDELLDEAMVEGYTLDQYRTPMFGDYRR